MLSAVATLGWLSEHPIAAAGHGEAHAAEPIPPLCGEWYTLAEFGSLRITIGYYIDSLTLVMFSMVTLVASCIHVYSFGYMREELDVVTDPMVTLADGRPLAAPRAVLPVLPVPVALLLQHVGTGAWPATSPWCSSSGNWSASAPIC